MRALRDFNTPKIVKEDEVVFFGLLGDLFPGLDPPRKLDDELESLVHQTCINQKLWPDETFRLKIVQLKELLEIRHCVFVMGPPGAGKTSCWKTLCGAQGLRGEKTKFLDINPKSITTHELYGSISLATREWRDGLLSKIMRDLGLIPDEKPKWIVLDGDLDANWIESMNSVMDDNRMLTLASNERIPLKAHMKMLFEIRDLRFASPATVSRAGILYISTDDGTQWRSLIHSWVDQKDVSQEAKDLLTELFERYVFETLRWLKKNVKPVVYLEDMNLVTSLLYMLDATFQDHRIVNDLEAIPKAFVYCMIWSMGSALTMADDGTDYKKMFSDWWRSEWRDVKIPTQYTIFDYWYDVENKAFDLWSKSPYLSEISFDSRTMAMNSVTVATPETCSVSYWMGQLVDMKRPIMLCGPSGTGKTQLVNGLIAS
jgi:dynein heavy chain